MNCLFALTALIVPTALLAQTSAAENPCGLLTDAEVRKAVPAAGAGKVDRRNEKHGILYCRWEAPGHTFYVMVSRDAGTLEEEMQGFAEGFVDARQKSPVRYEPLKGVKGRALAVVEKADAHRGMLTNASFAGVQVGKRVIILASNRLASQDRVVALAALADLAKAASNRL